MEVRFQIILKAWYYLSDWTLTVPQWTSENKYLLFYKERNYCCCGIWKQFKGFETWGFEVSNDNQFCQIQKEQMCRGRRNRGRPFLQGKSDNMKEGGRREHNMKEKDSFHHSSRLLSSSQTPSIWTAAPPPAFLVSIIITAKPSLLCTASSLGWPASSLPTACKGKNSRQADPQGCSLYMQPLQSQQISNIPYESAETWAERKMKHLLSLSHSLLFVLS